MKDYGPRSGEAHEGPWDPDRHFDTNPISNVLPLRLVPPLRARLTAIVDVRTRMTLSWEITLTTPEEEAPLAR